MSLLSLSLVAALGCDGDPVPATQVLVTINSDLQIGTEITSVQIEIRNAAGGRTSERHAFELTAGRASGDRVRFPFSFGVAKNTQNEFQLETTALLGEDEVVIYRVATTFEDQKTLGLSVFLGSACAGVECESGETCYPRARRGVEAGVCGDIPNESLDPVDPGDDLPDAGGDDDVDAAVPEGGNGGRGGGAGGAGGRSGAGAGGAGAGGASGRGGAGAGGAGAGGAGSGGAGSGGAGYGGGGAGGTTSTCTPACLQGETCVSGECECPTGRVTVYRDADSDGYGDPAMSKMVCGATPSGWSELEHDCCDSDARAYPGQEQGDVTPSSCPANGFDYNCDGNSELGWPYLASGVCCETSEQPGWLNGFIPGCGEPGSFNVCDETCQSVFGPAIQRCL